MDCMSAPMYHKKKKTKSRKHTHQSTTQDNKAEPIAFSFLEAIDAAPLYFLESRLNAPFQSLMGDFRLHDMLVGVEGAQLRAYSDRLGENSRAFAPQGLERGSVLLSVPFGRWSNRVLGRSVLHSLLHDLDPPLELPKLALEDLDGVVVAPYLLR